MADTHKNNKGGAPKGNRNRYRHGLHSSKLPSDARYLQNQLGKFRRDVEDAVADQHGEVSLYSAALILSALRHERRCRLLERWLRVESEKPKGLKTMDRVAILSQISAATDSRDRCLERLGLDKSPESDPWSFIDVTPNAQDADGTTERDADDTSVAPQHQNGLGIKPHDEGKK